ncbi:MAG: hypothetical protein HOB29_09420 [Planctomycetaceae bacterium]|nr:hypothetical protein [Planctomycetaceae bacterium]
MDYRIINFSRSLKDLESGEAATRFYGMLSALHREINLNDSSNVDCWKLLEKTNDWSIWIFENLITVTLDTPPIDRGYHRFVRLRSIYIDKDKRGFSLGLVRRCLQSLLDCLKEMKLPVFAVVKPYEDIDGKEIFHHSLRRQKALLNLLLDLGFQKMNQDKWKIKWDRQSECPVAEFDARNEDYPLEIPMLIKVPEAVDREAREYFESVII